MEKRAESAILALSPFYSTSHFESSKMRFEFLIFFLFHFPSSAITVDPKRGGKGVGCTMRKTSFGAFRSPGYAQTENEEERGKE